MAIDVSVQYDGRLVPDIILLTQCDYIGNPVNTMKSFCPYNQCSHLIKPFDMLRRFRRVHTFL